MFTKRSDILKQTWFYWLIYKRREILQNNIPTEWYWVVSHKRDWFVNKCSSVVTWGRLNLVFLQYNDIQYNNCYWTNQMKVMKHVITMMISQNFYYHVRRVFDMKNLNEQKRRKTDSFLKNISIYKMAVKLLKHYQFQSSAITKQLPIAMLSVFIEQEPDIIFDNTSAF